MAPAAEEPVVKVEDRKCISQEELAKHNTEKDAWICVYGLVLNLPADFLDQHPGGPEVVTCMAGQDATKEFEDIAHSDSAKTWANKYVIGYMDGSSEEVQTSDLMALGAEHKGGGGGGSGPVIGIVVALILAVLGYFALNKSS
mmetsp:Transcript_41364/g.88118  ORF Transcript_41364/g.88118 Transcript_41364/m.88118 type:complete len:143 (-) Transcript_41364:108-536(-)